MQRASPAPWLVFMPQRVPHREMLLYKQPQSGLKAHLYLEINQNSKPVHMGIYTYQIILD